MGNLNNICPGTYSITVVDISGLVKTEEVIISCDFPCNKSGSRCVEILPFPKSLFTTEPAPTNGLLDLCKGQQVQFTNASEDAPQTEWDFGDGTVSPLNDPLHTFSTPGIYEVKLIARNGCICADTSKLTVTVSDAEIPEIQCIGPICQGDSATYKTNVSCGNYQWGISPNGSIISGGGIYDDYLTVLWQTGNEGYVELTVSACTGSICDKPLRAAVSILGGPVVIQGPSVVCPNTEATFTIPDYKGSDIVWGVSGAGNVISEGQGTNKILVKWGIGTGGTVTVNYNNCFLECAGSGMKQVQIKPPSYIEGPIEICIGNSPTFKHKSLTNNALLSASWQIFDANNALIWWSLGTPSQVSPTWDFTPGQYNIRALVSGSNNGSCSAEAGLPVSLVGPPPTPNISGTAEICPTLIYTYTAQTTLNNASFEWVIKNGSTTTTKSGKSVNVKWGTTTPYVLTLRQIDESGPGCQSLPTTFEVHPIPALTITGPTVLCKETTTTYSSQTFQDIDYQWSVEPATAGGILTGQGTSSVQVFWQTPGLAKIKLFACGVESNYDVEVISTIPPQIVAPIAQCPGAVSQVQVLGNYANWLWKNSNGSVVSTSPSPFLGVGNYSLETTDIIGCKAESTVLIAAFSSPEIQIIALEDSLCNGSVEFHALQTSDGYNYQWYRGGSFIGANSPILTSIQPGLYKVKVTDVNGCTAISNQISIVPCDTTSTGGGGGGGGGGSTTPGNSGTSCIPEFQLEFDVTQPGICGSYHFQNTSTNYVLGSLKWFFKNSFGQTIGSATGESADFVFPSMGNYKVTLVGEVPSINLPGEFCTVAKTINLNNTINPIFSIIETCAGMPTHFTDGSTFMPGSAITAWSWDFGDPASGTSNTSTAQHPNHVFGQMDSYLVTLTVTSSAGCVVSFAMDVNVHDFPSVSFDQPAAICAASALNFTANGSNGAVSYTWNFGDPASGNGNFSQNKTTWHAYPQAGNYPVAVTAANVYGCTASYSAPVTIEANDLTGNITPNNPAPICEGTAASFTSPVGGSAWSWSSGATTSSITVSTAGVYAVTVTDAEGCVYKPEPVVLEVTPGPIATIRAVELNEFGQPVAYHPQSYTACEGEDVYLEMVGDDKYIYAWSDGSTGEQLVFAEANGSILPTGQHSFTVTVTDIVTGCTAVEGPFPVTINAAPATVAITSNPLGPLCDGTEAIFSVVNPQPGLTYLWNTGANSTSMSAAAAGSYLVLATNQYGCTAKCDPIEIHNAPGVGSAPAGCYTRCNPTEICLPQMPEIADYQWFLNGSPIPVPQGAVANFEAMESGDYRVQMTSIHGCVSLSDPLSLELEAPTGDIGGTVWLDANNNGLIDAADTPLQGIGVLLAQNSIPMDTLTSGPSGGFVFDEMPSTNYWVQLDTANLPALMVAVIWSANANLQGCHDSTGVQFLVKNLCFSPLASSVQLKACQGDSASYNGTFIPAGGSEQFILPSFFGCDSTVTVSVAPLSPSASSLTLFGCPGDSIFYASQMIPVGQTQAFVFKNQNGCDSTMTVTVTPMPTSAETIALMSCPGEPIIFDGQTLMPGDTMTFVYQNQSGCDSVVFVSVGLFQASAPTIMEMDVCPGDSVVYNGETLWPGAVRNYVFQDQNGCDSLVNVTVTAHPAIEFGLFTEAICPGTSEGSIELDIAAGDQPLTASLNGSAFTQTDIFEGIIGGSHKVQVQDAHGCLVSQSIEIQELAPLELASEDYLLPCDEPFVTLRPTVLSHAGTLQWQWEDGSDKAWIHAKQAGIYAVKISDDCRTEERAITVAWGDNTPAEPFYVPNTFSPNGDGVNDEFRVYLAEGAQFHEFKLLVFDRWGNQLFETTDPKVGWNGFSRDRLMDTGVVVWYVIAKLTVCGREMEVFKEGGGTVIR